MQARLWCLVALVALVAVACGGNGSGGDDADTSTDVVIDDVVSEDVVSEDVLSEDVDEEEGWSYTEEREVCAHFDPLRQVFFGDLHSHTQLSFDAWSYDNRHTPGEAYSFAKGESIDLPPLDVDGVGMRTAQLARPLDFAMVSDHSEFMGEIRLCVVEEEHSAYDSEECVDLRADPEGSVVTFGFQTSMEDPERMDICGTDVGCIEAAAAVVWEQIQQAAEDHYDRTSACEFTTFVGYEFTSTTHVSNNHRTVLFRNADVPDLPVSYYEAGTEWELWSELEDVCLDAGGDCEVITSAHNTNLSNGRMFHVQYPGATTVEEERQMASMRLRMERLIEIFQHKGDVECRNGFAGVNGEPDPLCEFEKQWPADAEDCGEDVGTGGMRLWGCVSQYDFVRNIFKKGLQEQERIGVNPFRLGITASTDTHNSTPGKVQEDSYPGHVGTVDMTPELRLGLGTMTHDTIIDNPGGLIAVWAEENARDSLYAAMYRHEVYATSGPRIELRMFGGWDYPAGACADADRVEQGYATGVPMGGELPAFPGEGSPTFMVWASQDEIPLQQLQIVKGWLASDGEVWEKVFDVAGDAENGADVDLDTCTPTGDGDAELCSVWTDPEFDPGLPAFYYARVVENPTCRWTTRDCMTFEPTDRPAVCDDGTLLETVQERAWSTPIWYTPGL